jgi:hypothetical protein
VTQYNTEERRLEWRPSRRCKLVDEQTDAPKRRMGAFSEWIIFRRRWVIRSVIGLDDA